MIYEVTGRKTLGMREFVKSPYYEGETPAMYERKFDSFPNKGDFGDYRNFSNLKAQSILDSDTSVAAIVLTNENGNVEDVLELGNLPGAYLIGRETENYPRLLDIFDATIYPQYEPFIPKFGVTVETVRKFAGMNYEEIKKRDVITLEGTLRELMKLSFFQHIGIDKSYSDRDMSAMKYCDGVIRRNRFTIIISSKDGGDTFMLSSDKYNVVPTYLYAQLQTGNENLTCSCKDAFLRVEKKLGDLYVRVVIHVK